MLVLLRTAVFEILHDNFLKMPKITTKRCYNFLKILYASETKNATVVLIGIPESFVSRSFMSNARAKSVEIERLLLAFWYPCAFHARYVFASFGQKTIAKSKKLRNSCLSC